MTWLVIFFLYLTMASTELPIFPLDLVLFPGAPQLLHIFEPRYRQMLDDCLNGARRFGISFIGSKGKHSDAPSPGHVGCTAYIKSVHRLPDGRSNLLAIGEERYYLTNYLQRDREYHVGLVETFDDDPEEGPGLTELADAVSASLGRLLALVRKLNDAPEEQPNLPKDPKQLSFRAAASVDVDKEMKQHLLEQRSTHARLEDLARIMNPINDELAKHVQVHVRAKRNGKGGHEPVIISQE